MDLGSRDRSGSGDANGEEQNGNGEGSTPTSHDLSVAGPGRLGPRWGAETPRTRASLR
jgi:hypothetical protein